MKLRPLGPGAAAIGIALVASFGFALVASCGVHTDDGCAVEMHCFACHWAFAGAAAGVIVSLPLAGLEPSGEIVPIHARGAEGLEILASPSRSPPFPS